MPKIDLDSARAARAEAKHEAPVVTFAGSDFTLPDELPFGVFIHIGELDDPSGDGAAAVRSLLVELFGDRYAEFLELGPSLEDIKNLVEGVVGAYGLGEDSGESAASAS